MINFLLFPCTRRVRNFLFFFFFVLFFYFQSTAITRVLGAELISFFVENKKVVLLLLLLLTSIFSDDGSDKEVEVFFHFLSCQIRIENPAQSRTRVGCKLSVRSSTHSPTQSIVFVQKERERETVRAAEAIHCGAAQTTAKRRGRSYAYPSPVRFLFLLFTFYSTVLSVYFLFT